MKTVELPQGTVEYEERGSGPTLLFVHGVLVDHRIWSGVIDRPDAVADGIARFVSEYGG